MTNSYRKGGDFKNPIQLNFRVAKVEKDILQEFALRTGRTQTDIIRELINSLKDKIPKIDLYRTPFDSSN
jgi:predicted DNA-binding protein